MTDKMTDAQAMSILDATGRHEGSPLDDAIKHLRARLGTPSKQHPPYAQLAEDLANVSYRSAAPPCTCPSGGGSLRWPCPRHPPAAGDLVNSLQAAAATQMSALAAKWRTIESAPDDTRIICAWLGAPGCSEVGVAYRFTVHQEGASYWCNPEDRLERYGVPHLWQPFPTIADDELEAALSAAPAAGDAVRVVAWVRYRSDGGVEGPILDSVIEDVRRKSGVWEPLVHPALSAAPTLRPFVGARCPECNAEFVASAEVAPAPVVPEGWVFYYSDDSGTPFVKLCADRDALLAAVERDWMGEEGALSDDGERMGPHIVADLIEHGRFNAEDGSCYAVRAFLAAPQAEGNGHVG